MPLILRRGTPEDATICRTICYDAFTTIAAQHNFPSNYPSPEVAVARMAERLTHPGLYAVVAELDGQVVGSNFLDERSPIVGLGPITVAPSVQNRAVGRHLMQAVLERVATQHALGVRLVHAAYHTRALSLYAKLGFTVRDFVARVTGAPLACQLPGYTVRLATLADLDACDQVCRRVHGHDRAANCARPLAGERHGGRARGPSLWLCHRHQRRGPCGGGDHGSRASAHWGGTGG